MRQDARVEALAKAAENIRADRLLTGGDQEPTQLGRRDLGKIDLTTRSRMTLAAKDEGRREPEQLLRFAPAGEIGKNVGSDDETKGRPRDAILEGPDGRNREARLRQTRLDSTDRDPGFSGERDVTELTALDEAEPGLFRKGVSKHWNHKHLIDFARLSDPPGSENMSSMGWIKGSTEDGDAGHFPPWIRIFKDASDPRRTLSWTEKSER